MKSSKLTAQQIALVLEQEDEGASIEDVCRKAGISIATYYHWYKKYGALKPSKIKRLRQLEDENSHLKLLVEIMGFDKERMRDVTPPAPAASPPGPRPASATVLVPTDENSDVRSSAAANGNAPDIPSFRERLLGSTQRAHHLGSRPAAMLSDAILRIRSRDFSWERGQALRSKFWSGAKRKSWGQIVLLAGVTGGLVGGFAFGLQQPAAVNEPKPVPVDMTLRFNTYRSYASTLEQGWKKPEAWGTWMAEKTASLMLAFDGPARGDVELLLEARARAAKDAEPSTLIVRFNDAELGRWRLPAEARDLRRRFIVPEDVFNRSTAARLSFEHSGDAPSSDVFGLQSVALRDARHLSKFRGYLDHCGRQKLVGWAVAEDTAVSVAASANGDPMKAVLSNVERADLATHGLPVDAGFELRPIEPIAAGTTIEVRFANGQRLIGSPCRP